MKIAKLLICAALCIACAHTAQAHQRVEAGHLKLWYKQPASNWNEALPVGNGRLGAMIFGTADDELLQLNENTLYSGDPESRWDELDITATYPEMVALLESGKYLEAAELLKQWTGRLHECYQPLGDWHIHDYRGGKAKSYRRYLDLERSVATVQFERDNYQFRREIFASHPDQVMVMRLTTNCPVGWDIALSLSSPHPVKTAIDSKKLVVKMSGQAPGRVDRRTTPTSRRGDTRSATPTSSTRMVRARVSPAYSTARISTTAACSSRVVWRCAFRIPNR